MSERTFPAQRQQRIYRLVAERGAAGVGELSSMLDVSEITIRRDLAVLERQGVLERSHGGAVCIQRMRVEPLFTQKGQEFVAQKRAIGRAAAELIEEGDTVFINSGSTTLEVIRNLGRKRVRVITNNIPAVLEVRAPETELVLLGGEYRPQSSSVVGAFASGLLSRVYGSKAVIGIDGFGVKHGLTTPVYQEAEIDRLMIERTRGQVIVVADHRKLSVVSNFVAAGIDAVDVLVTDEGFPEEYRAELEKAEVRIVVAQLTKNEHM